MLCIALLPLIFAVYVQISEVVIHHQMNEKLDQKNLVTIHIKSSQIVWTKKGKEANVNGNMFDVKNFLINDDDIRLTGLFDKDEDALFAQINNAQQKNNSDAAGSISVLKWFCCFLWNANNVTSEILSAQLIISTPIHQNNFLQSPVLACDTPSPKPAIS